MLDTYKDVLSVQQLQDALMIGRTKAYELLRSGSISSFRNGRQIRVPKQAVLDYIANQCYNTDAGTRLLTNGGSCNDV